MDHVAPGSCVKRIEIRLSAAQFAKLEWLATIQNRSFNGVLRMALDRVYEGEKRAIEARDEVARGRAIGRSAGFGRSG